MDNQKSNSGYLVEVEDLKEHFTIRTGFKIGRAHV